MQHIRCQQGDSTVMVVMVIPGEEDWQKARASSMEPKRSGNSGRYLRVLNWLSEYGLSSETWGRLWVLVTPRSAIKRATGREVIEVPRSAWMVRCPATIPCFSQVSAISRLASSEVSRPATIHPTT